MKAPLNQLTSVTPNDFAPNTYVFALPIANRLLLTLVPDTVTPSRIQLSPARPASALTTSGYVNLAVSLLDKTTPTTSEASIGASDTQNAVALVPALEKATKESNAADAGTASLHRMYTVSMNAAPKSSHQMEQNRLAMSTEAAAI